MPALYDTDFHAWALEQARAVREAGAARLSTPRSVDWDNIAEELEGMARSEARTLKSHLRTLLSHLLKWRHQPERRSASWEITIRRTRRDIQDHLLENPSLRPRQAEIMAAAYGLARADAADETGLPLASLPEACPFALDEALDEGFWPS
jgi:hypothetical protein